jgi:transposase InsO family protein
VGQGSQYTSETFQRIMADNGVTCSMSWSGKVWDNAAAESFFSSLKIERVKRKVYGTRDQARADVFASRGLQANHCQPVEYIEGSTIHAGVTQH